MSARQQLTPAEDGSDEHTDQQENELEALASIFGEDFQDLRSKDPWKVKRPPEVHLCLRPNGLNNGQESHVTVELQVKCPPTYPDVPPELELMNAKGLSNENLETLKRELNKLAAVRCGEVMIYELADHIQGFLSEHNKPPSRSFHEEMLKNQRRQQEKEALEEQKKRDQRRKQEEEMEKEIMAEIQRREEEKREEKRRKEMAKQERLETLEQPVHANSSVMGKRPQSPGGAVPEPSEAKKGNRRRTTSNTRHRRDTINEDNQRSQELLHFYSSTFGELVVHRGRSLGGSERLGREVYYGFEANSGDFVVVYEWSLSWNKKIGKFFTSQEKGKIDSCKKQIHGAENEFNSLLKLDHPNLVRYMALSSSEKDDCLVVTLLVEHVSGVNLNQSLMSHTPVPLDKLCHYTSQLLAALSYLHSNSVVHKQLGASSVLVDPEGNVRLTDYSLSKRFADICKEDIFEQAHVRFSEDTAMPTKTGKKGDVWNLGLMLLALSQGKEVKEYPVTVPTTLPADFQDFLHKCVCLNEAERWTPQQLLDHSFLKPPSPKNLPQCQDSSPEDLAVDFASSVIPRSHILDAPFISGVQRQFSRYFNEFEELQLLGKGAFGAVIKVQNKLDGCNYAVKRIQVNPASKQFRRIKGEVTLLSRLNHENIVRYYNAWIERHETPSLGVLSNTDSSEPQSTANKLPRGRDPPPVLNELGLPDNAEDIAPPPTLSSSVEWSTSIEKSSSAMCSGHQSSDDEDDDDEDVFGASFLPSDSDSGSDIIFDNGDDSIDEMSQLKSKPVNDTAETTDSDKPLQIAHYLYIQMEYCEKSTLRDTIDHGLHQDQTRLWRLFREILDGLAYIHEQGMIHRDLKPVNIFLDSQDHVKIGDFGLATDHPANMAAGKCEVEEIGSGALVKPDPSGNMTGMVGTALYVSPEVQGNTKATYNQKVDLFSLGIILFEMSYRPMTTGAERISVLSQLRVELIIFPEDFTAYEQGTQRKVIQWLLNHDPALRPTTQELLKSELLPPPQMEESELHEVLQHTMANINGKAYRTMVGQLFAQNTSPVMDYTYDIDLHKGSFSFNTAKLQQHVYETITRIFKKHGAVRLQTPLLLPRNRKLYDSGELACFMDHSGMLVTLPYDIHMPFARFVARNNVTHLKRYSIERVFRTRKLDRAHPRELLECAFDIITPVANSLLPDAETIYTISEIVQEFPALQERNYNIYLNHTSMLKAILLHSGVPEDKLGQASNILCDAMSEKLTKREVEAKFCNVSLSTNSLKTLYKYTELKGNLHDLLPLLTPLTKQKTAVTQLAKQGLKDLEEITVLLDRLGVKLQVVVNLGLVYKVQHHSGVIFQFVAFIKKRRRTVPDIVAAGGRYDHLILEFRGPDPTVPVPSAVGASVALDKICAAIANMEEPPSVSSCDALVVPVGHSSMSKAISVVQKLWSSGISADIAHDVSQSQETLLDHCKLAGITCLVLVSDKEGNYVKVKSFERDRQSEKRIPELDLGDHIIQKCRTKFSEERNIREIPESLSTQNPKGSLLSTTGSSEQHGSSCTMNMNVNVISPEKVSSSARRRYETHIQTKLQNLGSSLQNKSNDIEVLAVDLPKETLISFLSLEFDSEEQFNSSVKTLLSRLPKQRYLKSICDDIHHFKIKKRMAVVVLYSYKVDYYKILL